MQHNLVLCNGESFLKSGDEELYEFDVQECLMRLRWGKILSVTEERLGPTVSRIPGRGSILADISGSRDHQAPDGVWQIDGVKPHRGLGSYSRWHSLVL